MCLKLCIFVLLYHGVQSTPFELVDNYIDYFQQEMNHLRSYLESPPIARTIKHTTIDADNIKSCGKYDFIIVGGGSSGSVIANRLSEVPEWKILLLEAGGLESTGTKVPRMNGCLRSPGSPLTWGYYSTPQNRSCLDMDGSKCFIPTAKVLGGTTAINDMVYTRGNKRDYDLWADKGLTGWCSISLGPFIKNIEDAHLDSMMDKGFHHYGGPVYLESPRHQSDFARKLLQAAKDMDVPEIDLNGQPALGLGIPQLMTRNGQRSSAGQAYIAPTQGRSNIDIKPLSQVTRIIISEHTIEARAVEFIHEGQLCMATAKKEVILSAGSINTAKILLSSGIGPKKDLEDLQINAVMDLPVGESLIHHTVFPITYTGEDHKAKPQQDFYNQEIDYLRNGKGPLTDTGVELIGFLKTFSESKHLYPDVELLVTTAEHHDDTTEVTMNLILLHPQSRGSLKISSNDTFDDPAIDLNDYSDSDGQDMATMLSAIRFVEKLTANMSLHQKKINSCESYELYSDEYWTCAIKQASISTGEVFGSAPMGTEAEGDSVVDLQLFVHGVDKLRVADDSVIPVSMSGHLAAVKMVIGEKCADLVKKKWLM